MQNDECRMQNRENQKLPPSPLVLRGKGRVGGLWSRIFAVEGAAAPAAHPMAAMLSQSILQDGEIIILTLKPSLFFILFTCLRFCAIVLILMIATELWMPRSGYYPSRSLMEIGTLALLCRLGYAAFQWMGNLYILTDQRLLTITGVLTADVFNCPLRKVARTRLVYTLRERLLAIGSIEIIPMDESVPIHTGHRLHTPREVHPQIRSAMTRAQTVRLTPTAASCCPRRMLRAKIRILPAQTSPSQNKNPLPTQFSPSSAVQMTI